jgi:hypothetical protein
LTGGLLEPIWSDVEIARLDICFNQIFSNQNDKRIYLDVLKNIGAKRIKDYHFHSELHGIWYRSENFYYKIYDKGYDFSVHKSKVATKPSNQRTEDYAKESSTKDHQKSGGKTRKENETGPSKKAPHHFYRL